MTTNDMSRVYLKLAEAAVESAKGFESIGDLMEASKAWERAGEFAEASANASTNPADCQTRLNISKSFFDRASKLCNERYNEIEAYFEGARDSYSQGESAGVIEIFRQIVAICDATLGSEPKTTQTEASVLTQRTSNS